MDKIAAYEMLLENHPLWNKEAASNPYPLGSLPGDEALAKRFADARANRIAAIAAEKAKKAPLSRLKTLFRR